VRRALGLAAVLALLIAAPAGAAVSFDTHRLARACPALGVWSSGRPDRITAIVASDGVTIARRTLKATADAWRYYELDCPPPGAYSLALTYGGRQVAAERFTIPSLWEW